MLTTANGEGPVTSGSSLREGARGGVVNLLRMAKVHCGASVAFASLGAGEQPVSIASYPDPSAPSPLDAVTWDVDLLVELVHHAWALPGLSSGTALATSWVRSGPSASPAGPSAATVAAVPLCDETDPQRPWGLLCVAKEDGGFDDAQLLTLRDLGRRLTAYLRARQQVLSTTTALDEAIPASVPEVQETLGDREATEGLLEYLDQALEDDAGHEGVAVVLFDLGRSAPSGAGANEVAKALRPCVRQDDLVVALDERLVGVGLSLSTEPAHLRAVRERLVQAVEAMVPSQEIVVSVALAAVGACGADELLAEAAAGLEQE